MARIRMRMLIVVMGTVSLLASAGWLDIPAPAVEPPQTKKLAKSADVQRILDKYQAVRPGAEDLAWFTLDWATTLKDARERAAKEQRPILFLHTNGRGNLFCGFC
jgi:hypothetical protein